MLHACHLVIIPSFTTSRSRILTLIVATSHLDCRCAVAPPKRSGFAPPQQRVPHDRCNGDVLVPSPTGGVRRLPPSRLSQAGQMGGHDDRLEAPRGQPFRLLGIGASRFHGLIAQAGDGELHPFGLRRRRHPRRPVVEADGLAVERDGGWRQALLSALGQVGRDRHGFGGKRGQPLGLGPNAELTPSAGVHAPGGSASARLNGGEDRIGMRRIGVDEQVHGYCDLAFHMVAEGLSRCR